MVMYCISVRTGLEEKFIKAVQTMLESPESPFQGKLYFLKKQMRLKTGKEYSEAFFPGYIFFETEEKDPSRLRCLTSVSGFLRFLPNTSDIAPLKEKDLGIVTSLLKFGTTIGIVPVTFDENDRIVIKDGPFKNIPGKIVAVNRRNKRVNIELDFMNGMKIVGLTYEEVHRQVVRD
ncbi:MAG: hypothetical protein K5930_02725 [Treponemataceae bacterium]|nr:hypothetical protein [Treponemataceae bacterium]